ncbi:hypothetical protein DV738_g2135, partial [Chaetothyriales sp. CBS 135597]
MAELEATFVSPDLRAALPPPRPGDILTPVQWKTLLALCEPYFPAIPAGTPEYEQAVASLQAYISPNASRESVDAFLAESAVELPQFRENLRRALTQLANKHLNDLKLVVNTLNSTAGSLLLTGYRTPFAKQPLEIRSQIIANWSSSYVPQLRRVHRTFNGLTKKSWAPVSPSVSSVIGYHIRPERLERERADSYNFKFHDFSAPDAPTTLSADVIVIGSGCGAGVVASNLSRAGLKVLVLEKGYHYSAALFPLPAAEGAENLWETGGPLASEDASIVVVAGATWGGGGTINWSASLQIPANVRNEWIQNHGLTQLASPEFQEVTDYVCERMGVAKSTDPTALARIPHNFANKTLLEGSRKLGLSTIVVPQNTTGREHWCGSCSYGCSSCTKQGPANNWLPDAANHGAEFIEGCFVEKILWSSKDRSQATGVLCTWTSRDHKIKKSITIKAPRVVVSAGTLHSPLVLLRSGLKNRHIGKNLYLHPVNTVLALWPERIEPWEGPILTTAVTAFNTLDGLSPGGHGPVIECLCSTPAFATLYRAFRPGLSTKKDPLAAARNFKENTAKWAHGTAFLVLQRDRDTGTIWPDPENPNIVRVTYTTSHRDRYGIAVGQAAAGRIAYVQGAEEIDCLVPDILPFVRRKTLNGSATPPSSPEEIERLKAINDRAFEAWATQVQTKGVGTKNFDAAPFGSAHQMGTCRLSKDRDSGVVDQRGKVWGTKNVWVADASVFPTASGVNPMVTTMAFAEWIARGIAREVKTNGRSKL